MKILLITPPLTQLNTPYPATTVLKGFLQTKGYNVSQADIGIELINRIYTNGFLEELFRQTTSIKKNKKAQRIFQNKERYINCVDSVIRFLQGKDKTLAQRIANRSLLPEGPRFDQPADLEWAFGVSGTEDKARHLATLFVEDMADYIRETVAPDFNLVRYAERLATYAPQFDQLEEILQKDPNRIDLEMLLILREKIEKEQPGMIGFSVPFPGCFYAALRCGQFIKKEYPEITVVIGGGYPNTELRSLREKRIFQYTDYITLDDGELPLERLVLFLEKKSNKEELVRTFYLLNNELVYSGNERENIPFIKTGIPDFSGLPHEKYISLAEMTNPMHRLWTNGKWNKIVVAHGCYWAKCAFCDVSLDYICRYEAPDAALVVDKMEAIMAQTGESGFHFTDEALSPKLLREIALEILRRKLVVSFWGNIRFEKSYTPELCDLLAEAGCIAVSGGLEVASDRLLKLMNKGVDICRTAQAAYNLTQAGIMVHTYLMYGFPTETEQETINALEVIRQLFEAGIIQSAFWHRYAMTIHSPSGMNPEEFGVKRTSYRLNPCSNNEVDFEEKRDFDIEALGNGLKLATYNYMHDIGLNFPLHQWFSVKIPKTTVEKRYIRNIISEKPAGNA